MDPSQIVIPAGLKPSDGRFGSGPSKVRPEAVAALSKAASTFLGTSHRQATVKGTVGRLREALAGLFALPSGYEVLLGNGGTTTFWDAQVFGLIEQRSQHLVFGEFSSKFADAAAAAPHLEAPLVTASDPGTRPPFEPAAEADLYALTHNETSTGVSMPIERPAGSRSGQSGRPRTDAGQSGLVSVDGTSAAAGLRVDPSAFDCYYFAPQKGFASDGGLWIALCSPAAVERIETIASSGRYIPASLDLKIALENSRKDQTYNTPALATLFLMLEQAEWIVTNGGLEWSASRCDGSAGILYSWAEASEVAWPFVKDPASRSHVVGTIDFAEALDAKQISEALRANGIVDTEPYRKLGRNQLRIGMYPAIEPEDIAALTRCIDHVISALNA